MTKTDTICAIGKKLNYLDTGAYKMYPMEIQQDKCIQCGICSVYCPTNTIKLKDGKYFIENQYCKGCGICVKECPSKAVIYVKEEDKDE